MKITELCVWTWATDNSFMTFGRPIYYPLVAKIECKGPYDLGKGQKGYLVVAPNGKTFVAEATTGAFIGKDIKSVQEDVASTTADVCNQQVADAAKELKRKDVKTVDADEFWRRLKCL